MPALQTIESINLLKMRKTPFIIGARVAPVDFPDCSLPVRHTFSVVAGCLWTIRLLVSSCLPAVSYPTSPSCSSRACLLEAALHMACIQRQLHAALQQERCHCVAAQGLPSLLTCLPPPTHAAMNKVDRLYNWKTVANSPIQDAFARQEEYVRKEFEDRLNGVRGGGVGG